MDREPQYLVVLHDDQTHQWHAAKAVISEITGYNEERCLFITGIAASSHGCAGVMVADKSQAEVIAAQLKERNFTVSLRPLPDNHRVLNEDWQKVTLLAHNTRVV
jgi:ATP-dependent Clp protease adapter protein ClpS